MSNYIRTQSPWIAAAEGLQQAVNPLAQMYSQLPQIRAQMQQHADQMGIQQGRLNLEGQEYGDDRHKRLPRLHQRRVRPVAGSAGEGGRDGD